MTEAMVDDALVTNADRETLNAIRIALYRAHPEIPPFAAGIIEPYLVRHRPAGVAAGRKEAAKVADIVAGKAEKLCLDDDVTDGRVGALMAAETIAASIRQL